MEINQKQDPDYESVKIDYVGFVDPYAVEGMLVLKLRRGKREFHMRKLSGEVARHISSFVDSSSESVQQSTKCLRLCEENELVLVKVKVYDGEVLRANLYFTGEKRLGVKKL